MLYLSLVRSQLVYCLQVWRPSLVEEIKTFEDVQRSATKFILNDYISDYRTHRLKLHIMLPLSMLHELNDICFFVKSLKQAFISFTITDYVSFSGNNTRSGSHHKLVQPMATTTRLKHFYFNRLPHLWNSLPPSYQYTKKLIKSRTFSGNTSSLTLTHPIPVPITSVAHAPNVWLLPNQLLSSSFMLPNHLF